MSKALNSYDDVKRAWIRITSSGKHASLDAIYEYLGRRGSKTTLHKYRQQFLSELAEQGTDSLPPSIPPDMVPLIDEFFTKAVAIAGTSFAAARKEMEQALEGYRSQVDELSESNSEYREINAGQSELIDTLHNEIHDLKETVNHKNSQLVNQGNEIATLKETIRKDQEIHKLEIQRHTEQIAAERKEWERDREHLVNEATAEKNRAEEAIKRAEGNTDHFLMQIREVREHSQRIESNHKLTIDRLDSQLVISEKRGEALASKLGRLEERFFALQDTYDESQTKSDKAIEELDKDLGRKNAENRKLSDLVAKLEARLSVQEQNTPAHKSRGKSSGTTKK